MADTEYQCLMKGHEGDRTFIAASPEWFHARGMPNTPKKCTPCKEWINSQSDELATCICGVKFTIYADQKSYHFRKIGPYVPITQCKSCREGKPPVKGTKKRPKREKKEEEKKEKPKRGFKDLAYGMPIEPRGITYDTAHYEQVIPNHKVQLSNASWVERRWEHLMHHVPGSQYDWTDSTAVPELNLKGKTSPTSFAGFNASFEELLESVGAQLQQVSGEHVREYQLPRENGKAKIARVTFNGDHDKLELTILQETSAANYGIITTYDNLTAEEIVKNDWYTGKKD